MINEECKLNLAHQNLYTIPKSLTENYQKVTQLIDVSYNQLRDVSFLEGFTELTSIIVDHNELNSDVIFPRLPNVTLLWMNFNWLTQLYPFIDRLAYSFPFLKHLSLMGNVIVPPCDEDNFYHYLQYRLFIISRLPSLKYLDDRVVTEDERQEAFRLFKRPQSVGDTFSLGSFFTAAVTKIRQFVNPIATGYREESQRPSFI